MTHESKLSLETLRFCRALVASELTREEHRRNEWSGDGLQRRWHEQQVQLCRRPLAELDAEIAAKEAEGDA